MNQQCDLFGLGTPDRPRNPIEAKFWEFHKDNPNVYRLFCKFTRQAIDRGYQHFSSDMVMHRIRWETAIETTESMRIEDEALKLNNNYTAYYARLWMRDNPEYLGFFRTRILLNGAASERLQPESQLP